MNTVWILLLFVAFCFIMLRVAKAKRNKLKSAGIDVKDSVRAGTLIGGHPDINKAIKNAQLFTLNDDIVVGDVLFKVHGKITKASIKDVKFEDATTFEKRISAGRILLVGIFALAWKKKSKNENAYLVIEWEDGRFNHSTSFLFEGKGSAQKANAARNWLIKHLRS